MTKILITGATGKLGTQTIEHLIKTKNVPANQIVALVRNKDKGSKLAEYGVELREGAYDNLDSLIAAFEGIDKLLIVSSPELHNTKRLQQQLNAVIAAEKTNVKHIHVVGLAETEDRIFGLEDVDMATEHMVLATNIPYTFLKNSVYFDEIKHDINSAIKTGVLVSATGNKPFNYVLRNDLALVNATVLSEEGHENKAYYLTREQTTTYSELAEILSEITGKTITYKEETEENTIKNLIDFGMKKEYAESFVTLFQGAIRKEQFTTTSEDVVKLIDKQRSNLKESLEKIID